ncbi:MAG: hypothetical protein JWM71_1917, partial [Solirubrobacteraceae bacterium]|nr:hypothetical protein [Solirubrobacteraceae bacterium]
LVDGAGTAHVVFSQDGGASAPDTLAFCNLQRGIKTCASRGIAPNPTPPDSSQGGLFSGNIPAGNHDTDGPVPLAIGNQLYLIDRRFPDVFRTPDGGTSESNVFEWSSTDGGATPTGPGQLGDNQMAGGAVAFGSTLAPSIATISRSQTEGTFVQATAAGAYTTAKAQLGSSAQAYDGSLAVDGTHPIAAFDDTSGHILVRELTGGDDPNNAANWSTTTLPGYSPRIVGGPAGVFLLSSDSSISGGNLTLQRIVNGVASGSPVALGKSLMQPAISEDPSGNLSFAYTDANGIEVKTSSDGTSFGAAQLAAAASPGSIGHLVTASTGDGGGFVSYIENATGAEGIGQVMVSAFGTQQATDKPGLGLLPGGGIGSAAGDQLATSTCTTAGFGLVQAVNLGSCWAHVPGNPNLDVSLGEVDINGLRIIPDSGVRIAIDPKQHTIDTSGSVRVVLTAANLDITLFHGAIHAQIPNPDEGSDLFDFTKEELKDLAPNVKGFPVQGDIDFKLVKGGVQIPISLKMPSYFGGISGSTTLKASYPNKLDVTSVKFTIGDLNIAALELKGVDVTYTASTDTWLGHAELLVPGGGGALDSSVSVVFKDGDFSGGSLDLSLPYPGLPLDPPELYLSHGGLGFNLNPVTLTGTMGLGFQPFLPPTKGGIRDYAFSLDGALTARFGTPVTFTAAITGGFLWKLDIGNAKLVYQLPDQVTLNGAASFDLGLLRFSGNLGATFDPKSGLYGGQVDADAYLQAPGGSPSVKFPSFGVALNNKGFAAYVPPPGLVLPTFPPLVFFGTIGYEFGPNGGLKVFPGAKELGRFKIAIPAAGSRAVAATGVPFTVPRGVPTANLIVHGQGGAPTVQLIAPDGSTVPFATTSGSGVRAMAVPDASSDTTSVGIVRPAPGQWHVMAASESKVALGSVSVAYGVSAPRVSGRLGGRGSHRTLHYRATLPDGIAISFAERRDGLLHTFGRATHTSATVHFTPAAGPVGRRQVVAQITDNGLPLRTVTLGSFIAARPPKPGRARGLKVKAGSRSFTFTYRRPAHAARLLITIVASDGRHLQRVVKASVRRGSVPVIGFKDAVTVTVTGIGINGRRGPSAKATAKRKR